MGESNGRRLADERYKKFRRMGRDLARYQAVVDREVGELARRVGPVSRAWSQLRVLTEQVAGRLPHRGDEPRDGAAPAAAGEAAAAEPEAGEAAEPEVPKVRE